MAMQKLTDRQQAVFDYIRDSIYDRGYPPTLREIGQHLGIRSTNGVNDHLRALQRKGYVTREDMKSRTLRLLGNHDQLRSSSVPPSGELIDVPIVGRVAAGGLTEAIEQADDVVRVDRMLLRGNQEVFGLRIVGDSMIEAGIFDGDYVFVRKQLHAQRGEVVVAVVGDEATCKYYFPESDHIRLQPANKAMAPIIVPNTEWRATFVLGVVVGVYRAL